MGIFTVFDSFVGARIISTFGLAAALVFSVMLHPSHGQQETDAKTTTAAAQSKTPLDGFQFSAGIVRSGESGNGKQPLRDTLVFRDGQFSSEVCKRYNFASAPYWIRREPDQIHFLAELTSPTDGKMVWKGTIRDGNLEGTMRWTRKRWYWTIDAEHNIRGELKDAREHGVTD